MCGHVHRAQALLDALQTLNGSMCRRAEAIDGDGIVFAETDAHQALTYVWCNRHMQTHAIYNRVGLTRKNERNL